MARFAALVVLLLAACGGDDGGPASPDAATDYNPLDGIGEVELVAGGFGFVEGPQWLPFAGTLAFSDIPGDTIHQLTPPSTVSVLRSPSRNSNGLAIRGDATNRLLAAEHGTRRVTEGSLGSVFAILAQSYGGARLNSPNDLIVRDDGTVYFTDPPYGIDDADRELDFMGVFRISPVGDLVAEWMGTLDQRPNGIALSPDQRILYVTDTADGVVRAFDVDDDGSLSGERVLSSAVAGADGLAVDAGGHLFVATSAGITALWPDGGLWGTIAVPEQPANCAFGGDDGRTLYITARTSLYRVTLVHPGLP